MGLAFHAQDSFAEMMATRYVNWGGEGLQLALALVQPQRSAATLGQVATINPGQLGSGALKLQNYDFSSGPNGAWLSVDDLVLKSTGGSTGPFRYIVLFSPDSPIQYVAGYWDYGSNLTLLNGESLTIRFQNGHVTAFMKA